MLGLSALAIPGDIRRQPPFNVLVGQKSLEIGRFRPETSKHIGPLVGLADFGLPLSWPSVGGVYGQNYG